MFNHLNLVHDATFSLSLLYSCLKVFFSHYKYDIALNYLTSFIVCKINTFYFDMRCDVEENKTETKLLMIVYLDIQFCP